MSSEKAACMRVDLSLVAPAFNEAGNIRPFFDACVAAFEAFEGTWEVVFVDDGSKDATFSEMQRILSRGDLPCAVTAISFSRNFGKEPALYAGLEHARGNCVAFIDTDLQQRPETALAMYEMLVSDPSCDVVAAYQEQRAGFSIKNLFSGLYYRVFQKATGIPMLNDASDFRVFRRSVANALLALSEADRFSKGLFSWVGFNTLGYAYTPDERFSGETNWSFAKLLRYGIGGIASFTTAPLLVPLKLGVLSAVATLAYLLVLLLGSSSGTQWVVFFIMLYGSLLLLSLGAIGFYVGKVFVQGKERPIYVAREVVTAAGAGVPAEQGSSAGE